MKVEVKTIDTRVKVISPKSLVIFKVNIDHLITPIEIVSIESFNRLFKSHIDDKDYYNVKNFFYEYGYLVGGDVNFVVCNKNTIIPTNHENFDFVTVLN